MLAIADIATEDTCAAFHNTGMLARQTENKGCIVRTYDNRSVSVQGSHCGVTPRLRRPASVRYFADETLPHPRPRFAASQFSGADRVGRRGGLGAQRRRR